MTDIATHNDRVATVGIDLGKHCFHLIGMDARGSVILRQKLSRGRLETHMVNIESCLIGIEACAGAHHIGRRLSALGHDVRLIPAQYVKPFRKGQKNDYRDAEAIAEAVQRPTMRFVPLKSPEQLDLQALHRVRSRLVGERTAVINQLRGFLLECGVVVPQGPAKLRQILPSLLAQRTDVLSPRMVRIIEELTEDWRRLDNRIDAVTAEIQLLAREDECCRRLTSVPGIGVLTASAVVATIGNGAAFTKGRDFAAWLGLTPKQISTGDRTILGGLSKRGNKYVRTLFVIGARAVLAKPGSWVKFGLDGWLTAAAQRLHHNVLAAALANKLARIAWSVLANGRAFERQVELRSA
jgi:transposase